MRPFILWLALLWIGLTAGLVSAQSSGKATAYGASRESAERVAMEVARKQIIQALRERYPELEWSPPLSYLVQRGIIREERTFHQKTIGEKKYEQVTIPWRLTPADFEDVLAHRRQLTWAKVLVGVVGVLTLGAVYFRLTRKSRSSRS